jgi:hypothetical protein
MPQAFGAVDGGGASGASGASASAAAAGAAGSASTSAAAAGAAGSEAQGGGAAAQTSTAAATAQPAGEGGGESQAGSGTAATMATATSAPRGSTALRTAIRAGEIVAGAARQQAQQAASAAIQNARTRYDARIANTAGGRIAQSIRQSHLEPPVAGEVAAFRDGGGSIGAPSAPGAAPRATMTTDDPTGWESGSDTAQDALSDQARWGEPSDPIAVTRGRHQPTGVREDEGGADE